MSCQQVPAAPAFTPCPRSTQVGEFEVAISGGVWVAIGELRNPLASIHSQAELLQRTGDAGSRRHATEISLASERIREMLRVWIEGDRLVGTGTGGALSNAAVLNKHEFGSLTQQVIARAIDLYPHLNVRHDMRFGLEAVQVDARTYSVVLLNLLDNAAKYGGREDPAVVEVMLRVRIARGRVRVRVRDWGPGIPYNLQQTVFGKHQRAPVELGLRPGGLGVGLHLCQQLLSLHHGRLWLCSKPGVGTAFVIDLPKA